MKKLFYAALIAIGVVVIGGTTYAAYQRSQYSTYDTATTGAQLQRQIKYPPRPHQLTILFIYKAGCTECNSVRSRIISQIMAAHESQQRNFVMANAMQPSVRAMVAQRGINNDPTVATYYDGKLVQQYSGTNVTTLNATLTGHSLTDGKLLKATPPESALVVNDVTHTKRTIPYTEAAKLGVSF